MTKFLVLSRTPLLIRASALCVFAIFLLAGCRTASKPDSRIRFEFEEPHMGTMFAITLYAQNAATANAAAEAAFREVAKLDHMMTDYDPHSELMRLCEQPVGEPTRVSPELFDLLRESIRVAKETDGAFDITVGPFVRAWRETRKTKVLPDNAEIAELRKSVGWQHLRLDKERRSVTLLVPKMKLDLGGIAKGYAADKALAVMRQRGISSALVAASGDIAIGDAPPGTKGWKVGIQSLAGAPGDLTRILWLHNAGISTSGNSEQYVEIASVRYSHIIDPLTGLGMTNDIQTTILGPDATTTDGLDTPTAIMGVERGLALIDARPELAALFAIEDAAGRRVFLSRQFKKRFGNN